MVTTPAFFHTCVNKNFRYKRQVKKNPTLLVVVAAALIDPDNRILLQKRPQGRPMAGLWEFPGGKLDPDELPEAALRRELAEELGIEVAPDALHPACFASEALDDKHLLLLLYRCERWQDEPKPLEAQELGWFSIEQMYRLPMPPADLPLLPLLKKLI